MIGLQECGPTPPRASAPPPSSVHLRARERAAQAVDYYNTHVHRAWANAGLSRSSFSDRHNRRPHASNVHLAAPDHLYRSNSSLELLEPATPPPPPPLKREYGSHGSIDVIERPGGGHSDSFFAMLQDYQPAVLVDQRSPGPAEYLRGSKLDTDGEDGVPQSPKARMKLLKLWGGSGQANGRGAVTRQTMDDSGVSMGSSGSVVGSAEAEEIARRRAFTHYDCQSLITNLNYTSRMRRLLAKRRNTTTGASAATMLTAKSFPLEGGKDLSNADEDLGDGQSNDLVLSCPFFRNEIGGEEERIVSLTRLQSHQGSGKKPLHRPPLAYGVAVLEFPLGETHWRHSTCPYQRLPRPIESVDQGARYYKKYFYSQEHQNWFGMDEQLGPVAISIRRERIHHPDNSSLTSTALIQHQYRVVIRTSELQTFRGAILEDAIPSIKSSNSNKNLPIKEVLEYIAPEIQITSLRLGYQNQQTEEQILKLDEQGLNNHYKVGVMYCKAGQFSEEEMYNNEEAGPAFIEFLETIGKKVKLKGFGKYRAGLDNKSDSTGHNSVYAQYQDCEIMFHVSTMLPFTPNNRQQLLRKRHIGNDIVTIVFQEPGAHPFTPKGIRSQFQHVFIVVQAINPCTENTHYKVAVSRSKDVEVFGPPIKNGAVFPKGKAFAEFLLAKVVNAENAAHRSEKFVTMATRTRQEYLKELVLNHSTSTPVDTHQKFSIFSSKKKDKIRLRFIPDACQRGAILWQVLLEDGGQSQQIECYLGISTDSFVLIEEITKQIVFVTPCKSILGWSTQTNSIRIYHHQGECMTMYMKDSHGDRDEQVEIIDRLKAVTSGVSTKELYLKRNIMGQLGFHVQPDGIVTLVESAGEAWLGGLRQNSRLVEICKVAVSTLTYDQMVDLLKTSLHVTLTVIPPLADGSPRKGCTLQNCKYNEANYECDYENLKDDGKATRKAPEMQQAGNHRRFYDRSFSPPRSSNSSGYGTGSSSKSFHAPDTTNANSDDKWYDMLQELEVSSPKRINNTFPVKRSAQAHNHFGPQQIHHSKIQVSHSLPLQQNVNYTQPMTAVVHADYDLALKTEKLPSRQNDGHSTDSSLYGGLGSEDELSAGSGNQSPRAARRAKQIASASGSRNNSPRSLNGVGEAAKLRPGVTARSSNRSSANLGSSSFQEELMRLINPDSIASEATGTPTTPPEVILTLARPATVISNASTASSPLPAEFKGGSAREELKAKSVVSLEEFPVPDDWPTLVDAATRALMQFAPDKRGDDSGSKWREEDQQVDLSITSSVSSSTSVPELQNHVTDLESSLNRETRRRMSLENEVRRLMEENKKLKDQAQNAVQQLKKFTEWFFKNVQRQ